VRRRQTSGQHWRCSQIRTGCGSRERDIWLERFWRISGVRPCAASSSILVTAAADARHDFLIQKPNLPSADFAKAGGKTSIFLVSVGGIATDFEFTMQLTGRYCTKIPLPSAQCRKAGRLLRGLYGGIAKCQRATVRVAAWRIAETGDSFSHDS
jgi:hypothetical protein